MVHCKKYMAALAVTLALLAVAGPDVYAAQVVIASPVPGSEAPDTRSADDPFVVHGGDISIPEPVTLAWALAGTCAAPSYTVYLARERDPLASDTVAAGLTGLSVPVWNLENGAEYRWKVALYAAGQFIAESALATFYTGDYWPRMIRIDGSSNARDIGGRVNRDGVMVRQGMLYRSAELYPTFSITDSGIQQVRNLGVVCEIDLRGVGEGDTPALPADIRYVRICGPDESMSPYWWGLQSDPDKYLSVFRELAQRGNYPLLVHCLAGMDRTGTVAVLLEGALNCTDEHIILDYQWSSLSVYGARGDTGATYWDEWNELLEGLRSLDPAGGTLQQGARNYLLAIGMTAAELDSIRDIFLDGSGAGIRGDVPRYQTGSPVPMAIGPCVVLPGLSEIRGNADMVIYDITGRRIEYDKVWYGSGHINGVGLAWPE